MNKCVLLFHRDEFRLSVRKYGPELCDFESYFYIVLVGVEIVYCDTENCCVIDNV